ncbi:hypothetical protein ARMSODRAFT_1090854 [Armillaria solidipes]|uniref:Integral membrane protein n=1 Tax=Armillaria solidipes TaxID=1076256 RepID=A0A2H3AKD6_9AGAR|nr:hypothetical protein ARMSODRAFT_1090854 [Armillaria solidipes]
MAFCCDTEYHITRGVTSLMAAQTNIPPDVTDPDKALIFHKLDTELNSVILYSLLHGIYTGIVAVSLWNMIFMDKSRSTGRAMVVIIILLYVTATIAFAFTWSYIRSMFVDHGQSFWTKYMLYQNPGAGITVGAVTAGAICTVLADSTMVWRCWIVWGRRWLTVLLPGLFLVSHMVFKIMAMSRHYAPSKGYILDCVFCSSFVLASTLWCTLLIIYRIVTVTRSVGRLNAYRHVIEVLVESSALYSISLILFVAFYVRNDVISYCFDVLSVTTRGIAPTLLVGRVAAGHTHPDEYWQEGTGSSLRFATDSGSQNSQEDTMTTRSDDLEAQREIDDTFGRHMLAGSREDTANEGVIREDVTAEMPEAGRLMDENPVRGDDLDAEPAGR